ncbi:hypothetical protein VNO77_07698 [Canavalia gladiata]|uniref:Uncharacterized protein n=1 Tax=Canavalia gladiata TaxID=3824 RepID=A0AAN9MEK3_CANGL
MHSRLCIRQLVYLKAEPCVEYLLVLAAKLLVPHTSHAYKIQRQPWLLLTLPASRGDCVVVLNEGRCRAETEVRILMCGAGRRGVMTFKSTRPLSLYQASLTHNLRRPDILCKPWDSGLRPLAARHEGLRSPKSCFLIKLTTCCESYCE